MEMTKPFRRNLSFRSFFINNAALLMCVLLVIYNGIFSNNFMRINTLWNLLSQTAALMFAAMGQTLVISSGCTDLSIGSTMAIASSVCGTLMRAGWNAGIAILVSLIICVIIGLLNGTLVAHLHIQPMVAMLVSRMVWRAVANIYTKGITQSIETDGIVKLIAQTRIVSLARMPVIVIPMLLVVLITVFIVKKMKLGRKIEAVGNNQRTAYLCGVSVAGTILTVYVLSACFAGVGGMLEMFRSSSMDSNTVGIDFEMFAIAAATIGGTNMRGGKARIMGSVFGALLMTLITMTVNYANITYEMANVFKAAVIVFAIALQSSEKS
ncbi:MAG TPA: ABC transporter permease [Candidatus Pullichristensenella excrementigallinarum]|uniref:ABC transporter permease n=1 Tax=Candidatus Pullichristensenella excrementigallinarum TaxID=2840907 RepID=A0A9D1IBN1_9FIRM|nr:ABC transporter permease [Candidatus Pullichristensenella excrementigallinarum]